MKTILCSVLCVMLSFSACAVARAGSCQVKYLTPLKTLRLLRSRGVPIGDAACAVLAGWDASHGPHCQMALSIESKSDVLDNVSIAWATVSVVGWGSVVSSGTATSTHVSHHASDRRAQDMEFDVIGRAIAAADLTAYRNEVIANEWRLTGSRDSCAPLTH